MNLSDLEPPQTAPSGIYKNGLDGVVIVWLGEEDFIALTLRKTHPDDRFIYIGKVDEFYADLDTGNITCIVEF